MTLPNFLIAGAPKCGTTALWGYLSQHPDVFMAPRKEPRFFTAAAGELEKGVLGDGPNRSGRYSEGLDWYRGLFRGYAGESAVGEASTAYFSAPDSPDLIRRHVPDARILFVLRDPVARAYSHYWEEKKLGWPLPDFSDLVQERHARLRYYLFVSRYRQHLTRYLECFPRDRVLVLLTEELQRDGSGTFSRVCEFLGVDPSFRPGTLGQPYNQQTLPRNRRVQAMLAQLQGSRWNARLPGRVRGLFGQLRRRITAWNSTLNRYPALTASDWERLVDEFGDDIDFVEELTGRTLDAWRMVSGVADAAAGKEGRR